MVTANAKRGHQPIATAEGGRSDAPYLGQLVHGTDARPILEVEGTHEPKGRASSPLRADDCNHAFLQRKEWRARSDAPYLARPVHGPDARLILGLETSHEPK